MIESGALTEALHDAVKAADPPCGVFCRWGIEPNEGRIHVWHNGAGRTTTDEQYVYAEAVLKLSATDLTARLKGWLCDLHRGRRVDLNAV